MNQIAGSFRGGYTDDKPPVSSSAAGISASVYIFLQFLSSIICYIILQVARRINNSYILLKDYENETNAAIQYTPV